MKLSKKENTVGLILVLLLAACVFASAYYYMGVKKIAPAQWLLSDMYACASVIFLVCYVLFRATKSSGILSFSLLPLYYYGTMGVLFTPWNSDHIFPLIAAGLMTLVIIWSLYVILQKRKLYRPLCIGVLIGLLVFVPLDRYVKTTPNAAIMRVFQR